MQQEREKKLARLLQEYFSKETAAKILGTTPDLVNRVYPHLEQKIGGFALYPMGAVAKELLKGRHQVNELNCLRMLADALAEKFSDGQDNEEELSS